MKSVTLEFHNLAPCAVKLMWVDYEGQEKCYSTLEAEEYYCQATYNTHPWRIRDNESGLELYQYTGDAATITINSDYTVTVSEPSSAGKWQRPEWGQYRQRGSALGIAIMAYDCVQDPAVLEAEKLLRCMMQAAPAAVLRRLQEAQCQVAIIGRQQVTTDIPAHHFMKHCKGRDIDGTTRGLGGTAAIPVTSCGEENLTMVDDSRYPCENILVHEFGHTVMNVGLAAEEREAICQLYRQARQSGMYSPDIYMMDNEEEYWAEGCQTWFDATVRCDVNDGINTREALEAHDPGLAQALRDAFGDNPWRYPHTAPAPLRDRAGRAVVHSPRPAGRAHVALQVQVAPPGAAGMERTAVGGAAYRQGCMSGPVHCVGGCWSAPRQLWGSFWGRSQRGGLLTKVH